MAAPLAVTTPPRRALHDLSVNAQRTLSVFNLSPSSKINVKRNITEVEDPAAAPAPSRLWLSKQTESSRLEVESTHNHSIAC